MLLVPVPLSQLPQSQVGPIFTKMSQFGSAGHTVSLKFQFPDCL